MSRVVSIDGQIVPAERATVSVFDRGFLYGDGIFESIRVYAKRPFAKEEHFARLARSATALRIPLPVSVEVIGRELEEAVRASGEDEAYVRIMLTRGVGSRPSLVPDSPLTATRVLLVEPLRVPPREVYAKGVSAVTLKWGRFTAPGVAAKSLPYVMNYLALEEARGRGADEAIFVGPDGLVREATTANVFVVDEDGALVTPTDGPQVLGGITRGQILDLAVTLGFSCAMRPVPQASLASAREVFLTSSIREVLSVVKVDGVQVGEGKPGDFARTLHSALRLRAGAKGPNPWE